MYSEDDVVILNRMKQNVPSDIDKSEGSFIHDALSPISQEIAKQEINLDEIIKRAFAITAAENGYSTELENRCAEQGIVRKKGTAAYGQATFTGSEGTAIPKDTLIQTEGGLQYKTIKETSIKGGVGLANIVSAEAGSKYNVPSNTIVQLPIQVAGVIKVSNVNPTIGGNDVEDDEGLLKRYLLKVKKPSTGGNKYDYMKWATEVDGIGGAKVFPIWKGNGTVKLCVIDSNNQSASEELVLAVKNHVEELRPIGAEITYKSAETIKLDINVSVIQSSEYTSDQIKSNIANNITAYLQSIAFKQNFVSYAQIGNAILASQGVQDYSNLKINGNNSNVNLTDEQIAILGTVTVL